MTISNSDIFSITQSVLELMANLGTSEGPGHTPTENEHMTGCVQISGTWKGAIIIQTSTGFAKLVASHMFEKASEDVSISDMQDSLAEITNMIGGNIKSQVPGPSYLSIPSVTTGQDFSFRLKGAEVVTELAMNCSQEPLNVLICVGVDG